MRRLVLFAGEFLKLDKWLNDKVREHGELFIIALVKFVQQRCPGLSGGVSLDDPVTASLLNKASHLPHDTLATITQCLTPYAR